MSIQADIADLKARLAKARSARVSEALALQLSQLERTARLHPPRRLPKSLRSPR